jgi:uncharacterized lipoprotein YbaY
MPGRRRVEGSARRFFTSSKVFATSSLSTARARTSSETWWRRRRAGPRSSKLSAVHKRSLFAVRVQHGATAFAWRS